MTSINLTIHNKESIIANVLRGILSNATGDIELVVCFDGCTDKSEVSFIKELRNHPKQKIKVLYADNVFETKANNMAAKASSGEYIIIVQDDQIITELGWNKRILAPFKTWDDVFAVTARTAHNWKLNPDSQDIKTNEIRNDRWCDILIHCDHADLSNTDRNIFAIRDTVNRSPLAIRHSDLQALNYFDEAFAPQEFDEHDLMYRMHEKLGKVCGFYDIDWYSRPEWGSCRNPDGSTKGWVYENNFKNCRLFYERHNDKINREHKIENRTI